jgi:hypothetical protein
MTGRLMNGTGCGKRILEMIGDSEIWVHVNLKEFWCGRSVIGEVDLRPIWQYLRQCYRAVRRDRAHWLHRFWHNNVLIWMSFFLQSPQDKIQTFPGTQNLASVQNMRKPCTWSDTCSSTYHTDVTVSYNLDEILLNWNSFLIKYSAYKKALNFSLLFIFEWACKAIGDGIIKPAYLRTSDHNRKNLTRKKRTDVGKYSFVNNTIKSWNQLPTSLLESFPCKLNTFRKRVKKVIRSKGIQVGTECK